MGPTTGPAGGWWSRTRRRGCGRCWNGRRRRAPGCWSRPDSTAARSPVRGRRPGGRCWWRRRGGRRPSCPRSIRAPRPTASTARGSPATLAAVALRPYPVKAEAMEALDQLLAARRGLSQSLARLRQQRASLPAVADVLAGAITDLDARLAALDRQIAGQRDAAVPAARALATVPGIGPVTAAAVASCLHSKDFAHPDHFVAYIGLDVRVRDSGTRRGRRALSKQGDAELRR